LLLLVAMLAATVPANAAGDAPKPLSSRRLFDQSRPGVQLILVDFSASLNVPQPTVTEANGRALQAIVADRVRRGEIEATQTAVSGAVIEEMARNPFRWITATGQVYRTNIKLTASGSGFSISPDGYVVTNAHVVAPNDDTLKAAFLAEDMRNQGDDFVGGIAQGGLTQRQAQTLVNTLVRWATKMATLGNFKRKIVVVASSGSGATSPSKRRVAKLIDAGEEFPGKDVAVIKVEGHNMATVPLGDETALSTGDRLFVLGFPGPATFNPDLSKDSQGEPTLTQGVLSAKKQVKGGYTVLQTDAGMTHGNSGGPVFDEQGRVVGVATLGSVDSNTGREVSGLNFAVPASIVNELLGTAHVTAEEGTAARTYRQALDAYDKQWYKRGLPLFERVKALDPGHPLVAKLIKESQTAIDQGRDRTPREILGLPMVQAAAGAGVAVVVLLVLILVLVSKRRRRKRRRAAAAPANGWGAQPGGWDTRPNGTWSPQPAVTPNAGQEGVWSPAPEAAWGPGQEGAWNAGQQASWSTRPDAAWSPGQQEASNAGQQASWDAQQQPAWKAAGQQASWDAGGQPAWDAGQQQEGAWGGEPEASWDRGQGSAGSQSWWDGEEARTAELPRAHNGEEPRESRAAEPPKAYNVCGNCGVRNHPSLRYCEQCWSALVPSRS
jgi:S1-C subfamily serine protease